MLPENQLVASTRTLYVPLAQPETLALMERRGRTRLHRPIRTGKASVTAIVQAQDGVTS